MYTQGRYTTLRHGFTTILSISTLFIVRHPLSEHPLFHMNDSHVKNCSYDVSCDVPKEISREILGTSDKQQFKDVFIFIRTVTARGTEKDNSVPFFTWKYASPSYTMQKKI